jgi:hypothetical protein
VGDISNLGSVNDFGKDEGVQVSDKACHGHGVNLQSPIL